MHTGFGIVDCFDRMLTAKQTTETGEDTDTTSGTAVSIYDIQTGAVAEGETVTLQKLFYIDVDW